MRIDIVGWCTADYEDSETEAKVVKKHPYMRKKRYSLSLVERIYAEYVHRQNKEKEYRYHAKRALSMRQ
jgi:hypothetical protein